MAAKDNWKLKSAIAQGLINKIKSIAAAKDVGVSSSLPNNGASSNRICITDARITEGDAPVRTA